MLLCGAHQATTSPRCSFAETSLGQTQPTFACIVACLVLSFILPLSLRVQLFNRMCSQGFCFDSRALGVEPCSDVDLVFARVVNRLYDGAMVNVK